MTGWGTIHVTRTGIKFVWTAGSVLTVILVRFATAVY